MVLMEEVVRKGLCVYDFPSRKPATAARGAADNGAIVFAGRVVVGGK